MWPGPVPEIDFGRPNAKIGRKMANGRLLFLALRSGKLALSAHLYFEK